MLENVSKELLEQAKRAKTKEEALAILRAGGVELTDEDLQHISAGEGADGEWCPMYEPCTLHRHHSGAADDPADVRRTCPYDFP